MNTYFGTISILNFIYLCHYSVKKYLCTFERHFHIFGILPSYTVRLEKPPLYRSIYLLLFMKWNSILNICLYLSIISTIVYIPRTLTKQKATVGGSCIFFLFQWCIVETATHIVRNSQIVGQEFKDVI